MGIDAEIVWAVEDGLTAKQQEDLAAALIKRFGTDAFYGDKGPIVPLDDDEDDYLQGEHGPNYFGYELKILDRYYGEHYERGNWPRILTFIDFVGLWIRRNLDSRKVIPYYFPDSACLTDGCTPLTSGEVSRTWQHWALFGNAPYEDRMNAIFNRNR